MLSALSRRLTKKPFLRITDKYSPFPSNHKRYLLLGTLRKFNGRISGLGGCPSRYREKSSTIGHPSNLVRCFGSKEFPEHVIVKLPALSPTMEAGGVATWNKNEGDAVSEGDVIAEVETDKATMAIESGDTGFVAKILIPAGTPNVKVGTPICVIVTSKEDIAAFKDYNPQQMRLDLPAESPKSSTTAVEPPSKPDTASRQPSIQFKGGKKADEKMPIAAPRSATPKPDKGTQVPPPPFPPRPALSNNFTDHPVTNIRAVIAKRLVQSKKEIPHCYLSTDVDLTKMEAVRKMLNAEMAKSGVKISVNDIIVKAAALACKEVPEANSSWMGKTIRQFGTVDVCVAVSTPAGLITPIVFGADVKVLRDISSEVKDLARRARQGKLKPHEFQGGTFTVSNLGMYGIAQFLAIINPPQSCILAVGSADERLFMKDSKISTIGVKKLVSVCLSCDHRVVDGSVGAQWLQAFSNFIQEPKNMF